MSKIIALSSRDHLDRLVVACRKGDERAMREVFQRLSPKMLGVCRRYLYRIDLAEEALSAGFARAFDRLRELRKVDQFEGWLKSIVVRECLDTLRREKRYQFTEDPADLHLPGPPSPGDSNLGAQELLQLIDELPTGYRTVFNLFAIEGYGHAEIADLLGISPNTSKTQYHKARAALRERMAVQPDKEKQYGSC